MISGCSGGTAPVQVDTSCRNSTDSLCFPNVFTRDILTQVLNPPEKVHREQFLSHSLINLDLFTLEGQKTGHSNSPGQGFHYRASDCRFKGITCHAENLPAHQVAKISKDHVTDGAEVLSRLVRTKLHEDDLFASDFRRALDHQSSFLPVSR